MNILTINKSATWVILLLLIGFWLALVPAYAFTPIWGGEIRDDKAIHYLLGFGQQALYESWGYTKEQAFLMTFCVSILKEAYDEAQGSNDHAGDILATVLGAWSFGIAEGVNLRLLLR